MISTEEIIEAISALPGDVSYKDLGQIHQALVQVMQRRNEESGHQDQDSCPDCGGSGKFTTDGSQSAATDCPRCRGDGKYHPHSSER